MTQKNTEFFIARRISQSNSENHNNIMVKIATLTVSLGIAVMIITLAVIFGFKNDLSGKLTGFGSHVEITSLGSRNSLEKDPILRNKELVSKIKDLSLTKSIDAFATKGGIIKGKEAMQGVLLKGNEQGYDSLFFKSSLIEGSLPRIGTQIRNKDILISKIVAQNTNTKVGDKIEMLFLQSDQSSRRDLFKVRGIYETGFEELDKTLCLTDMRNIQRLNNWDSEQITGYEIISNNFDLLAEFDKEIYRVILETPQYDYGNVMSVTIIEKFQNLFDWLAAHNINAVVMIVIMTTVALFNMISAMLIILLERTSMIGILKALGMNNRELQRLFIIRSSFIVIKGVIWGNIVGIGLALIQYHTKIIKLDQSGYLLNAVPVNLELGWIILLNLGVIVVLVGLMTFPAMIVSMMKPEKTIRFQ